MYNKITLCGSTRFIEAFKEVNAVLTLEGNIVYSVAVDGKTQILSSLDKARLDAVHMVKIMEADELVIVNVDLYIGESTMKEIEFAKLLGKPIYRLSDKVGKYSWWLTPIYEKYSTDVS
jgi:hypothetical protein